MDTCTSCAANRNTIAACNCNANMYEVSGTLACESNIYIYNSYFF